MKMKRILYISQYFYPEVFRGNDIAFHWAELGHEVHVITGIPNYPGGTFFEGYGLFKRRIEIVRGVKVTRLPIVPRGKGKLTLMLNYLSFLLVSSVYVFFMSLRRRYDFVFVQQLSPVFMAVPAVIYKKLRHVPVFTWVLDLWPENLVVAGGINNKKVLNMIDRLVKILYANYDKILISSMSFRQSVLDHGSSPDKVIYFPQWADNPSGAKTINDARVPRLPEGFKILFAGAIGEAHGFECNMQAALLTKDYPNIKWVIVGDGRKLDWVRKFVQDNGLENTVLLMGRYDASCMSSFFEQADVLLASLSDSPIFNMYLPAKISAYFAAGKPVIACMNGEGADVVTTAGAGWHVAAGDAENLAQLTINLSADSKTVMAEMGRKARAYYQDNFEISVALDRLDNLVGISNQIVKPSDALS